MTKDRISSEDVNLAVMANDIGYIKTSIKDMNDTWKSAMTEIKANYVSKVEFDPLKRLVYGVSSVIVAAVIGAIVTAFFSLIRGPQP